MASISPTGIAVPKGALGNVSNLATQIRSQSVSVIADAVLNLQAQINAHAANVSNVSTSLAALAAPPTPGSNPAAPYTDLPTGFAVSNSRYDVNSSGQQVLKLDATWTNPTDVRYGGSYIVRKKPSDAAPTVVMALNAGVAYTVMVSDFPTATETWHFWLISQDTSGNLNTSLTAPVAGTPTLTLSVSPPLSGGSGTEYCANVSLGTVSVNFIPNSDGTIQQYISAGFTPPSDARWGGVEIRVYNGVSLVAKNDSAISPILVNIPNPASVVTYTVKLVSYDVNNHSNSEQTSTPQTTEAVGSAGGTLDLTKYLPTSSNLFTITGGKITIAAAQLVGNMIAAGTIVGGNIVANTITASLMAASGFTANMITTGSLDASIVNVINLNASQITTGHLYSVDVKVVNYGGSGIITDITQGMDALFGVYTGVRVYTSLGGVGGERTMMTYQGIGLINSSNQIAGSFNSTPGYGLFSALDPGTNNGVTINSNTPQIVVKAAGNTKVDIGVDGSNFYGFCQMIWGATTSYAVGVTANGKRIVGGAATLSGGQVTIVTGLSTIDYTNAIGVLSGENVYIVSNSGGTVVFGSSNGSSTMAISWFAFGNS